MHPGCSSFRFRLRYTSGLLLLLRITDIAEDGPANHRNAEDDEGQRDRTAEEDRPVVTGELQRAVEVLLGNRAEDNAQNHRRARVTNIFLNHTLFQQLQKKLF